MGGRGSLDYFVHPALNKKTAGFTSFVTRKRGKCSPIGTGRRTHRNGYGAQPYCKRRLGRTFLFGRAEKVCCLPVIELMTFTGAAFKRQGGSRNQKYDLLGSNFCFGWTNPTM